MSDVIHPTAVELLAWIREHFQSIPRFCEEKGLDRFKIQKVVKGELQRIDVDFALSIERATDGAFPVASWETPSELLAQQRERRTKAVGRRIELPESNESGEHAAVEAPDTEAS